MEITPSSILSTSSAVLSGAAGVIPSGTNAGTTLSEGGFEDPADKEQGNAWAPPMINALRLATSPLGCQPIMRWLPTEGVSLSQITLNQYCYPSVSSMTSRVLAEVRTTALDKIGLYTTTGSSLVMQQRASGRSERHMRDELPSAQKNRLFWQPLLD
jgi:hypothetical protein